MSGEPGKERNPFWYSDRESEQEKSYIEAQGSKRWQERTMEESKESLLEIIRIMNVEAILHRRARPMIEQALSSAESRIASLERVVAAARMVVENDEAGLYETARRTTSPSGLLGSALAGLDSVDNGREKKNVA